MSGASGPSGAGAGGEPAAKIKVGIFFDLDQTLFIPNLKSSEPWIGGIPGKESWVTYLTNLRGWAEENNIELHVGIVTMKARFDFLVALAMRTFKDFLDLNHDLSSDKPSDKSLSHYQPVSGGFPDGAVQKTDFYCVWTQTIGTPTSADKSAPSVKLICPKTARHVTCLVINENREFYEEQPLGIVSKVAIVSSVIGPFKQAGRLTKKPEAMKKIAKDHRILDRNCILIDDQRANLDEVSSAGMHCVSAEHLAAMIDPRTDLRAPYDGALQRAALAEIQRIQKMLTTRILACVPGGVTCDRSEQILKQVVPPIPAIPVFKPTSGPVSASVPALAATAATAGSGGSAGVSVFFRSSSDFYPREPWCSSPGALGY